MKLKSAKNGSKNGARKAARPHATPRQQAARRKYLELTDTKVSEERIAAIRAQWIPVGRVAKRWMKEPGFREGYDALEPEFALASLLIEARSQAHLTQAQLAKKMGTSPSAIARLESGKARPSLSTLERLAKATGMRLKISLEPASGATGRRFEASPRKTSGRASPSELAAMRAFLRATGGPVPRERIEAMLDEWRAAVRPRR